MQVLEFPEGLRDQYLATQVVIVLFDLGRIPAVVGVVDIANDLGFRVRVRFDLRPLDGTDGLDQFGLLLFQIGVERLTSIGV